jgi:FkbM family methyltransferase|tara:strand:- start:2360 stop:2932 length:573 start_codon:yes stop_codon:yes gene_type:complete
MINFIQIGTSNAHDHCYRFVKDQDIEFGVLVEPMSEMMTLAKECYGSLLQEKNISTETIAIVPEDRKEDKVTIWYHWPNTAFNSIFKEHTNSFNQPDPVKSFEVDAMTINGLFEKYSVTTLDYLFVDTEGLDGEILMSIDTDKYTIKEIMFEHHHLRRGKYGMNILKEKFEPLGYTFSGVDSLNTRIKLT